MTVFDQLLVVQDLDVRIAQLNHRRATLPELAALEANAAEQRALATRRDEVAAAHKELVRRQHLLEDEINQVTERAATHEANLYSGSVTNPRELQALQDDIEALKRRQRALEDDDLEIMEALEPLTADLAGIDEAAAALAASAAELRAAADAAAADIDAELAAVGAQRDEAVAAIDPAVVADYQTLRDQYGGIAIARLENGTCGGCHLTLSAMELDRIRRLAPDERAACEECGRLLVR